MAKRTRKRTEEEIAATTPAETPIEAVEDTSPAPIDPPVEPVERTTPMADQGQIIEQVESLLEDLDITGLNEVIAAATDRREGKEKEARAILMSEFEERASQMGFSFASLFPQPKSRRSPGQIMPKYRHPTNPELTWSGRGMKSSWLRELEEQGHNIEEYRVNKFALA